MKNYILRVTVILSCLVCTWGDDLKSVNINFMTRGYCYAGSRVDQKALGGFGKSDNSPKRLAGHEVGRSGQLALVALPQSSIPKLRFVLQGNKPLYSNELEGSINPGQFTQKQEHAPTDLMDASSD